MTEPTPKQDYRYIKQGELLRDTDELFKDGRWVKTEDAGRALYEHSITPYRRPIQSFTEADPDEVAFQKWWNESGIEGTRDRCNSKQSWFAALAYARGKKG